eukprot:g29175.t2
MTGQAEFEPQTAPATELTVSGLILGDVRALPERSEAPECPELRWDEAAQEAQQRVLEALDLMPRRYHLERGLLLSLAKKLTPEETLQNLPRQLLMLYVKSAQSLLFNEVLSQCSAHRPAVGDWAVPRGAMRGGHGAPTQLTEECVARVDGSWEVVLPLPALAQGLGSVGSMKLLQRSSWGFPWKLFIAGFHCTSHSEEPIAQKWLGIQGSELRRADQMTWSAVLLPACQCACPRRTRAPYYTSSPVLLAMAASMEVDDDEEDDWNPVVRLC